MPLNLKIINPIVYPDWDKLLLSHQDYSFFHTSHWAKVLCESYGYKPLYFVEVFASNLKPQTTNDFKRSAPYALRYAPCSLHSASNEKLMTCLPLMEVKSFLTGQRGVSLPFTDYCDPIVSGDIHFQEVFNYLIEYGKQASWKFIEIRGGRDFLHDIPSSSYYYGHTLNLSQNEEQIFCSFRSSTRRNIRKAIREGVEVKIDNSLESIKEFYRLNCMTRKHHGIPPQPYYFFEKVYDYIISRNYGFVVLASYKGKNIAGAVYFHFGKKAIFKYGASDRRYQRLRPNNLIMWEAIKWYSRNGYEHFSFGKTEPENKGLIQFKDGWGAEKVIIKHYRYDLNKSAFMNGNAHAAELHSKVFNKMPIPLLKVVGSLFYKHVG